MIVSAGELTSNEIACCAVCCGLPESLTCTVKLALVTVVGVPLSTPVELLSVIPEGRVPAVTVQLTYGGVPFAAVSTCENGVPTVALKEAGEVMVRGASTVRVKARSSESISASVTRAVKLNVPLELGVPEMTPAGLSVKPAGSDPVVMVQSYGAVPFIAASGFEYKMPCTARGVIGVGVVIWTGELVMLSEKVLAVS